jgi:hypothetical protein
MGPPMADTATAVGIVPSAEPGALAGEANRAVRPVLMPVVASGVSTAVAREPRLGRGVAPTCHAFPTSSRYGADGRQIDLCPQFID